MTNTTATVKGEGALAEAVRGHRDIYSPNNAKSERTKNISRL